MASMKFANLSLLIGSFLVSSVEIAVAGQGTSLQVEYAAAQQLPRLHSLLISCGDELLFEEYYNGRGPSRSANMKSASKSVISALVGIAIDQGLIDSVDVKLAGNYSPHSDAAFPAIAIWMASSGLWPLLAMV